MLNINYSVQPKIALTIEVDLEHLIETPTISSIEDGIANTLTKAFLDAEDVHEGMCIGADYNFERDTILASFDVYDENSFEKVKTVSTTELPLKTILLKEMELPQVENEDFKILKTEVCNDIETGDAAIKIALAMSPEFYKEYWQPLELQRHEIDKVAGVKLEESVPVEEKIPSVINLDQAENLLDIDRKYFGDINEDCEEEPQSVKVTETTEVTKEVESINGTLSPEEIKNLLMENGEL